MRRPLSILLVAALATTVAAQAPTARDEEFARRQYDSGLTFLRDARYGEALKDFQAVVDSFGRTGVADDALVQIAEFQLTVARDLGAAQVAVDRLLKEYPDADATPMAYVIAGRLAIARSRTSESIDTALASFERVPRLFPGADAVPAALYYAGEALRIARRPDEALARFRRVVMEYPRSIWAARATIASGVSHVQGGNATRAFEELQRIRQAFPGTPEAATALAYNTILHRLYVRAPQQPPFAHTPRAVGPEAARYRDVLGLAVDDGGRVIVGHRAGLTVISPSGAPAQVNAPDISAFAVDERGRLFMTRRDTLMLDGGESTALAVPEPNGRQRPVEEIPALAVLSNGERLVADTRGRQIIRVSGAGQYVGPFAPIAAERIARSRMDDVAVIERDGRSVSVFDRDGKSIARLPQRGTGYQFDSLTDLAFDPLGHLYVLDRGRASVFVFGPGTRLLSTVTITGREPGSLQRARAMALDASGRVHVYDEQAQRIQVYQ
jgi:TolA-binding protein